MDETVKILLIEDNPGDTRLIQEMVVEHNKMLSENTRPFEVVCEVRLKDGLKRLTEEDFHVVLLDLSLPDSRGLDTFSKVYKTASQLPIIVLSGMSDETVAVDAVRKGAQDYLVKGNVDGNLLFRAIRYAIERKKGEEERNKLIIDLKQALAQIKTLSGLIPICASCKKIRDDKGYWNQLEEYIQSHSEAEFSHGICPACARKLYPELMEKD